MKKSLLSVASLALAFGLFASCANALELQIDDLIVNGEPVDSDAYVQILNNYDTQRGFSDSTALTCNEGDVISIVSPAVEDRYYDPTQVYRLFVSPYRVEQLKTGDPSVELSRVISKEANINPDTEEVTFEISPYDVDPNTPYYGFILPIDEYDQFGIPSKEICFHVDQNICMLDYECDSLNLIVNPVVSDPTPVNTEKNETGDENEGSDLHGAACVGMDLAHVSHTTDGKNITLTWTQVDGETVDIFVLNPDEEIYEKLDTVKMSDEKYTYPMRWNGVHEFRLANDCGYVKYKAEEAIEPEKTPEIVTPATGPAENILYIAIAAIVLYGAYVIFFRKAENK